MITDDLAIKALELEEYIRDYVPYGWKVSIESAMLVPWVSIVDMREILSGVIPNKFERVMLKEAVESWLENEKG